MIVPPDAYERTHDTVVPVPPRWQTHGRGVKQKGGIRGFSSFLCVFYSTSFFCSCFLTRSWRSSRTVDHRSAQANRASKQASRTIMFARRLLAAAATSSLRLRSGVTPRVAAMTGRLLSLSTPPLDNTSKNTDSGITNTKPKHKRRNKTASTTTAAGHDDDTILAVPRVFQDSLGHTHLDEIYVRLHDKEGKGGAGIGQLSDAIDASAVQFRRTPGDYNFDWHNAPAEQVGVGWWVSLVDGPRSVCGGRGGDGHLHPGSFVSHQPHHTRAVLTIAFACIACTLLRA